MAWNYHEMEMSEWNAQVAQFKPQIYKDRAERQGFAAQHSKD